MRPAPRFAPAEVEVTLRAGGGTVLRSPRPLEPYARCLGDLLERWARAAPERIFLAERERDPSGGWRRLDYRAARATVLGLAQALLDLGLGPTRPLLILSDNSLDHAVLALAAMQVGIPVAPLSVALSLLSRDHVRLCELATRVGPGLIFADDDASYGPALAALAAVGIAAPVAVSRNPGPGQLLVADLAGTTPGDAVTRASAAVTPDSIAKILFTSGSTGVPKGVVNTQRMLCSNQQAIAQIWPFLADRPPILCDWLPWSHTFGGNHNFNLVLQHGGTLYLDGGKPMPALLGRTVANLREVSPTIYFNVPRGFDMLLGPLERDAELRDAFFRELDLVFYAAAALPQHLWQRLEAVSQTARGDAITMISAWGSTETSPMVTSVHFRIPRAGVIGLPAPGSELALVPVGQKLEMRVRGPNVTPGYWQRGGGVTPIALDEDGFLPMGDAGRLADPAEPARGVVFDGRTAENFKLATGTWVHVGELRLAAVAALAPLVSDAVVTGHDRDQIGLLVFPSPSAGPDLGPALATALRGYNAEHGASSQRIARALVLTEPPSIDAGEITDKGYLNQAAVLARRAAEVARLYAEPPDSEVILP